jgi:hypothetical protein
MCIIDSGRAKLFARTDSDHSPAIGQIEIEKTWSAAASLLPLLWYVVLTRSPKRLQVAVQPNGIDCGYHVLFNAKSLAVHVNEGRGMGTWLPPPNSQRRP